LETFSIEIKFYCSRVDRKSIFKFCLLPFFTNDGNPQRTGAGGKQVKGTVNGVTTYYVGAYYQKEGTVVTKYYYAGAERVAMRQGGVLYYIFGDHLGSTAVVKNTQGGKTELRYTAWGTTRYEYGSTPTERRYTGQREVDDIGLYFYNARWYDPALGRFIQADSIVPGAGNPQAWDRYAYANNNPLNYTDPGGHKACGEIDENGRCDDTEEKLIKLLVDVEITLKKQGGGSGEDTDGDGIPETYDPAAKPVTIGTSPGCNESTYVECFYARKLLNINGSMKIDNDQFALLLMAVFHDIRNRNRSSMDRARYDTPFWDAYGEAPGEACYDGRCYERAEVNYFAQGMWSAANGQSLKYGEWIVDVWKEQYGGSEPSEGTLYWFQAGYVVYGFLDDN
jgi:RHS repeat-associated protein